MSDAMAVDGSPSEASSSDQQSAAAQDVLRKAAADDDGPDWSTLCLSPSSSSSSSSSSPDAPKTNEDLKFMARDYFMNQLGGTKSDGDGGDGTNKKNSPSEMLSELVASLEPVLGGSSDEHDGGDDGEEQKRPAKKSRKGAIKPKVRALYILCGSIEACGGAGSDNADGADDAGLTSAIVSLLGKFLMSYCLPYEQDYTLIDPDDDDDDVAMGGVDDNGDDVGEAVRDAAIMTVAALASAKCCSLEATSGDASSATAEVDATSKILLQRLQLTERAVECRCLSEDMTDYEHQYIDHGYGDPSGSDRHDAALEGLATLPRARRSLCFSALDGAVAGCESGITAVIADVNVLSSSMVQTLRREVNRFVTFVATCLHGETDPRCLLQMLRLLHRCQVVFLSLFAVGGIDSAARNGAEAMDVDENDPASGANDDIFPKVSIFDSIAPYYPIKFTPPPNDPYGITRDGLRDALMAVMCTIEAKQQGADENSAGAVVETMTSLSAKLFLERLVPPKSHDPYGEDDYDDGGETTEDKIEALKDLKDLFFPTSSGPTVVTHPLGSIDSGLIKELSSVLIKIHGDAIMDIAAAPNANDKDAYKTLLEECRGLAAAVAEKLESLGVASSLWNVFVLDTVRDMASVLGTAPQGLKGRSATAYISSLAACGGMRTLRTCLDGCLPVLVGVLRDSGGDEEKGASAALAAGTLFSSSEKSLSKASAEGIAVHPHPLQQYASDAVRALVALRKEGKEESLRIAAVNALGASLLAIPSSILGTLTSSVLSSEGDDVKLVKDELLALSSEVISASDSDKADWALACSRVVGSALGRGLASKSDRDGEPCVLDDNDVVVDAIIKTIFSDIIGSATTSNDSSDKAKGKRYDFIALSNACEVGGKCASRSIVSELLSTVLSKLNADADADADANADNKSNDSSEHPAVAPVLGLSHVLKKGGDSPALVYHELSAKDDVIEALCALKEEDGQRRQVGMSKLLLPGEVEKEKSLATERIDLAYSILPHILPAYQKAAVPTSHFERLVNSVSKVLPPLSQKDNVRLSVTLPLVATILANPQTRSNVDQLGASLLKTLEEMASPIAEYALCSEWDPKARSAASSCLFQVFLYYQQDKTKCISSSVLKDSISPAVVDACEQEGVDMTDDNEEAKSFDAIKSSLDLLAVVGSAAACRGGISSPSADAVTRFLINVACEVEATVPISEKKIAPLEDSSDAFSIGKSLPAIAASSFGMMLSVQNGGPFWRQRMIHIALPPVIAASKTSSTSVVSAVAGPPMGSLIAACHIICCTPMVVIGDKRVQELINMIARGFVEFANARTTKNNGPSSSLEHFEGWNDLMTGLLASMLKLMSSNSDAMLPFIAGLIPNFLVVCSVSSQPDDIPSQLLALQCLVAVTHLASAKRICKAHKVTVTSGLGELMDHPSAILRQAAVHARNVWFMLE